MKDLESAEWEKNQISDFYFSSYAEKTLNHAIFPIPLSANLFRLESSIQKQWGPGGEAPCKKKITFFLCSTFFKISEKKKLLFWNFSNLHERSRIGLRERKTKFPIFIYNKNTSATFYCFLTTLDFFITCSTCCVCANHFYKSIVCDI